jgi:hypothetical protein
MTDTERFFRAAGYLFTWAPAEGGSKATLEMWRESADAAERYWVTRATCRPHREGAYAGAMALVAWVQSLDVPARRDPKAHAVMEQLALTHDRLRNLPQRPDPAMTAALKTLVSGRAAAA